MIFIKIDGADQHLFQWDKGQRLIIYDVDDTYCAEFAFFGDKKCTPSDIYDDGGVSYCDIPDGVLTRCGQLICYLRKINEDKEETVKYAKFSVKPRPRPDDYVDPDEILVWHDLENRIKAIEEIDLSTFATEEYVDNKVSEIDFDKHYAGSLVYISEDGSLIPLLLGSGLKIIDGVISLNIVSGSTDKIIEAVVDSDGIFRVYNAGSEVIPEVDENGTISWPGVTVSVDSNGTLTFGV